VGWDLYNVSDVYIFLNVSGTISEPRYFKQSAVRKGYAAYFTAIVSTFEGICYLIYFINLELGNITSVIWDDDLCSQCEDINCIDGKNCAVTYKEAGYCGLLNATNANSTLEDGLTFEEAMSGVVEPNDCNLTVRISINRAANICRFT
jgi:hypothetical protein